MKKLIAIVDDEPDILELVAINLEKANFRTAVYEDAGSFLHSLEQVIPDLLILDLMLPDADGFDICKQLKKDLQFSAIPVIMLTARGDEMDRILGLEFGADDYVVKPFSVRELIARVKAVLRRENKENEKRIITIADLLTIDLHKHETSVMGEKIDLTTSEFKILKLLALKQGWVYSRNQILDQLWGNDKIVLDRTIDVHIKNLRDKLKQAGKFIKNIRGVGYKIEA
ncbi:MAG: hypothetical protein APR54_09500 [Candidatus Cloacimonas sp. SDB]|nr:MAG: hypothetical protein APR54_09500 [Candidatus Cloacimonas sp. SDB]